MGPANKTGENLPTVKSEVSLQVDRQVSGLGTGAFSRSPFLSVAHFIRLKKLELLRACPVIRATFVSLWGLGTVTAIFKLEEQVSILLVVHSGVLPQQHSCVACSGEGQ